MRKIIFITCFIVMLLSPIAAQESSEDSEKNFGYFTVGSIVYLPSSSSSYFKVNDVEVKAHWIVEIAEVNENLYKVVLAENVMGKEEKNEYVVYKTLYFKIGDEISFISIDVYHERFSCSGKVCSVEQNKIKLIDYTEIKEK